MLERADKAPRPWPLNPSTATTLPHTWRNSLKRPPTATAPCTSPACSASPTPATAPSGGGSSPSAPETPPPPTASTCSTSDAARFATPTTGPTRPSPWTPTSTSPASPATAHPPSVTQPQLDPGRRARHAGSVSLVRSAGLQQFRHCVEELGGDAEAYARRAGLPVEALDTDELLVEDQALALVLEHAAVDLDCPDLGMRVGEAQDFRMLGPLSVAIQHSPSVADALECTSRYLFVHARDLSVSLIDDPDGTRGVVGLRYAFDTGVRPLPQATDTTVMFVHRAVQFLVGGPYGLGNSPRKESRTHPSSTGYGGRGRASTSRRRTCRSPRSATSSASPSRPCSPGVPGSGGAGRRAPCGARPGQGRALSGQRDGEGTATTAMSSSCRLPATTVPWCSATLVT
ncbi:Virulence-regulating protein VirS [Streptomyces sp. MA5143a]|nr:Virulence-regulating protein VirS [Streptomyces sp. MA5143a]